MAVFSEKIALLIEASTGGATQPLDHLAKSAKTTEDAFDRMGKKIGVSGATLKSGLAAVSGAAFGAGLVAGVQNVTNAYIENVTAAGQLAAATNSTIESASRFNAVVAPLGLDMNDLTEIFADFQQSAAASADELDTLGVSLVKTSSGATDWIATAEDFLQVMQDIPDATERNRLMFKYFGEEGAKQLMTLVNSGKSLKQSLEEVRDTQILHQQDLENVQRLKEAMFGVQGGADGLANTLGRALVPALTIAVETMNDLAGFLASIPAEVYIVVGAFVALNVAIRSSLVAGAGQAALGLVNLLRGLTVLEIATYGAIRANEALKASFLTNPFFILGVTIVGVVSAVGAYNRSLDEAIAKTGGLTDETARLAVESRSVWESIGAAFKDTFSWEGLKQNFSWGGPSKQDLVDTTQGTLEAKEATEELAVSIATVNKEATDTLEALTSLYAKGGASAQELADAALNAAEAQQKQADATRAAKDAMDAAIVTTEELVDATLAVFDADIAHDRARFARQDAVKEAVKLAGDENASRRKQAESILAVREASLKAAQAYVTEKTASLEAAGQFVDEADKRQFLIDSLKRQLKEIPKSLPEARAAMKELIAGLEGAEVGPITIDGIQFRPGTTEKEIDKLKGRLDEAIRTHDWGAQVKIQKELDKLKMPPMPVTLTGPGGEPLGGDVDVKVNVDTTQARAAVADLTGPREVLFSLGTVGGGSVESILNALDKDRDVFFDLWTRGAGSVESIMKALDKDRDVYFNLWTRGGGSVESIMNTLDNDRDVYFKVHVTGAEAARRTLLSIEATSTMNTLLTPMGMAAGPSARVVNNTSNSFSINVSGAGNPAVTAREIDRYIRRAGDRSKVSVSG